MGLLEVEKEMTLLEDEDGHVLVEIHDFWGLFPTGSDQVMDLGLDAIQLDCLRIGWEEMDSSSSVLHPHWNSFVSWAASIHKEWETLG